MSSPPRVAHVTTIDLTLRKLLLAQLCRLRDDGFEVYGISAPGPSVPALEAEGIQHVPWPHATRSWAPRADARAFKELVSIFRTHRFDLVHLHNPKPGVIGRMAGRIARVPCVMSTSHGIYATPDDRLAKRAAVLGLEALAARCSDLDLYQSHEDLQWVRRRRVATESRSELLGNGIDLTSFDPARITSSERASVRAGLGIPEGALVVGTIGRLVEEKGYRELMVAVRELLAERDDMVMLVVGEDDPEKADALGHAEIEGEGVICSGWREDVPELLSIMDVFVLASWREGMPRSAIEAAAMGKPLVLTDIRGCREVVSNGIEGLLVPVRDPGALRSAIASLLDDAEARARMGSAARRRALEWFDEQRVTDHVALRTRELLARKGVALPHRPDVTLPEAQ
ncbi:MAG: glycosyltransferase family 4 protein [Actinomycetota bacterium]